MNAALYPSPPAPQFVMSADGLELDTYDFGDSEAPAVLAVHGFASSAVVNWHAIGWTRDLVRAGFRVIAMDQRGHGQSTTFAMLAVAVGVICVVGALTLTDSRTVAEHPVDDDTPADAAGVTSDARRPVR